LKKNRMMKFLQKKLLLMKRQQMKKRAVLVMSPFLMINKMKSRKFYQKDADKFLKMFWISVG